MSPFASGLQSPISAHQQKFGHTGVKFSNVELEPNSTGVATWVPRY